MTRPLRIEFPGALYHVTSRGDRRQTIFADGIDRDCWLEVLRLVRKRFNFVIHAYCQMGNHYHVMLETVEERGTGSVPTFGCWLILAKRLRQVAELPAGLEQDDSRARTIDLIGVIVATQV